jgi:hypothetical protein
METIRRFDSCPRFSVFLTESDSMFLTITCKYEAESKSEIIETFGSQYELTRAHLTQLKNSGAFGPPSKVEMRHLVIGSTIRIPNETENVHEIVEEPVPNIEE